MCCSSNLLLDTPTPVFPSHLIMYWRNILIKDDISTVMLTIKYIKAETTTKHIGINTQMKRFS